MADDRQDLLNAINSFLDCSIVLPPSEMGGDELLRSVARFQREMLRKREEQGVKLLAKEPKSLEEKGTHPSDLNEASVVIRIIPDLLSTSHRSSPHTFEEVRRPLRAQWTTFWRADPRRATALPEVPE